MAYSNTTSSVEKYPYPWEVNVQDFVPDKLSEAKCYHEWKRLMLDFIESQGLLGFVDGSTTEAASKRVSQAASWKNPTILYGDGSLLRSTKIPVCKCCSIQLQEGCGQDEETAKKLSSYLPLRIAAIEGDWDTTSKIIESEPDIVRAAITPHSETALFLAVKSSQRNHFVEKILKKMSPEDAGLANLWGMTALHRAASVGNVEAAKLLVNKNPNLPNVLDEYGTAPLNYAASIGSRESVVYLWEVTKEVKLKDGVAAELLRDLTRGEHYDIALTLLQRKPEWACMEPSVLNVLVEKCSSFRSGTSLNFWQSFIYSGVPAKSEHIANCHSGGGGNIEKPTNCCIFVPQIKNIRGKKLIHHHVLQLLKLLCVEIAKLNFSKVQSIFGPALLSATYAGIHEIVEEIIVLYPLGMDSRNLEDGTLFQYAIMWRRERVFNLIYQLEAGWRYITLLDKSRNNGLHLAGYLRPQQKLNLRDSVAGPVFQMQRELQWFKEVEKLAKPGDKDVRNTDRMTPAEVFTNSHQELVKEGEQWMKDTATSCTTVATLIAIFAAAVIILGRNSNNDGHPLLSKQKCFIVFGIFDTLALFSSMTSALMFLLILISRYASDDFLYALPKRLIIGFTTLFVSMLSTMVAFGAILHLLFGDDKGWFLIPIVALGSLPVTLFGTLHFPLLVQMIQSTYGRGLFGKQSDSMLG
ncbi:hypothetical protein RHSIM_Rhsim02G0236000 [Rhododendron simsii]|uniref:PGG domain-containing protein n=1 Tax=Rhododendron simsii TaxID=118357 RepID=A0A834HFJ4_RHOSS|nr:hypothetical protein RHSIM_Rhsim02G0236000 [Rhododendron simsii]